MRVLMLAQFYPPSLGGEEQHVRNLALGLADRGHEVAVATLRQPGQPASGMDGPVRVYRMKGAVQRFSRLFDDDGHRFAPPLPDPETVLELRKVIGRERPDVVHAHNWAVHSFLPLKPFTKAKLVITLHDYSLVCSQKRLMRMGEHCDGPAPIRCLRCAGDHYGPLKGVATAVSLGLMRPLETAAVDHFIAVSEAVAKGNMLDSQGLPYEVIPNFVADDVSDRGDSEAEVIAKLPTAPYIMYAGDLSRDKGVLVLAAAYSTLRDAPPLLLIGKPRPETPKSWREGIHVFHSLPHGAVIEAWRRAAIAVAPSVWPDPCPTVAMEAMSLGVPVVAARSGGLVDIVSDGESGLLVPPGDVDALAEAIQKLIDDEPLRSRLGQQALVCVRAFQASSVIPRIEAMYERLVERQAHFELRATEDALP